MIPGVCCRGRPTSGMAASIGGSHLQLKEVLFFIWLVSQGRITFLDLFHCASGRSLIVLNFIFPVECTHWYLRILQKLKTIGLCNFNVFSFSIVHVLFNICIAIQLPSNDGCSMSIWWNKELHLIQYLARTVCLLDRSKVCNSEFWMQSIFHGGLACILGIH